VTKKEKARELEWNPKAMTVWRQEWKMKMLTNCWNWFLLNLLRLIQKNKRGTVFIDSPKRE